MRYTILTLLPVYIYTTVYSCTILNHTNALMTKLCIRTGHRCNNSTCTCTRCTVLLLEGASFIETLTMYVGIPTIYGGMSQFWVQGCRLGLFIFLGGVDLHGLLIPLLTWCYVTRHICFDHLLFWLFPLNGTVPKKTIQVGNRITRKKQQWIMTHLLADNIWGPHLAQMGHLSWTNRLTPLIIRVQWVGFKKVVN